MLLVMREGGQDDLDLVAHVIREERAQRAIDHARVEDGLLAGAAFAAEEAAGDASCSVQLLLEVHAEGEEVDAFTHGAAHRGGSEDDGVAEADGDGCTGLFGQRTRLDDDGFAADIHIEAGDGSHRGVKCFHRGLLCAHWRK